MNDAMATRLRQIRQKRGYRTAKGAAEAMGMKYPTYSEHERNGEMRYSSVLKYARFFRVPPDWLLHGGEEKEILTKELQKDDLGLMQVKRVPLFDLADLDHFMQIRAKAAPYSEKSAFMPKSENVPPRLFSTKVGDKSMTQTVAPSLPAGTTIFVDPDADPQPGEMVLAVI
jgi:transcriptional regulator with XRE-family HTH domain